MGINDPNLKVPLAISLNERNIDGYAASITNSLDQLKINSMYEPVQNALTGKATLYLCARPGVADSGSTYGSTGYVPYNVINIPASIVGIPSQRAWVLQKNGDDVVVSDSTSFTTILASATGGYPAFVDALLISGTFTVVVQISSALLQRVFFASTRASWTEITDGDFLGSNIIGKMEFLDGFAFYLTDTNRIYNSDLNSLANWTATNFIAKQIKSDIASGLMRHGNQILAFGRETVEVFRNAGYATGSPLETVQQLHQKFGMRTQASAQGHYYTSVGDKTYFIAQALGSGTSGAYAYNGNSFEKISSPSIDKIIAEKSISAVHSVDVNGQLGIAFTLTQVTAATQIWLVYFPLWKDWFEWTSTVFSPINSLGLYLGMGSNGHKLYRSAGATPTDSWQDAGTDYTVTHQFQIPKNGAQRKRMPMFGLIGDTARSAATVSVSFSDDDYQTFSTARTIDMTSQKKEIFRCGSYQDGRAVKLSWTGSQGTRLEAAMMRIE